MHFIMSQTGRHYCCTPISFVLTLTIINTKFRYVGLEYVVMGQKTVLRRNKNNMFYLIK